MIKFTIKPGFYEKRKTGKNQPGLDLWRVTLDSLVDRSLAITTDCCNYYPTAPTVLVANASAPTQTEMDNAGIPVKGLFFAENASGVWSLTIRTTATTGSIAIASND